jgi:hypothetical protein
MKRSRLSEEQIIGILKEHKGRRTGCRSLPRVPQKNPFEPPCPGTVEAFCIGWCQDLFQEEIGGWGFSSR